MLVATVMVSLLWPAVKLLPKLAEASFGNEMPDG